VDRDGHTHKEYAIAVDGPAYVIIVRPDGVVRAIVESAGVASRNISRVFSGLQATRHNPTWKMVPMQCIYIVCT